MKKSTMIIFLQSLVNGIFMSQYATSHIYLIPFLAGMTNSALTMWFHNIASEETNVG